MLRFTCIILLIGCCLAEDLNLKDHWGKFKSTFKKSFNNKQQETLKQAQWEGKVKGILKHNVEADMGTHTYKKAVNEFTDLTQEELNQRLGLKMPQNLTKNYMPATLKKSVRSLPANFDWRNSGSVAAVRNQGTCGSCWAFAVSGAMEGVYQMKTGNLVDLSKQELVDCATPYGTTGCSGGWPNDAFKYIQANGIGKDTCYPYQDSEGQCRTRGNCMVSKIQAFYDVPKTEADLLQYLYDYGPIVVVVYVNDNFSGYSHGIYTDNNCNGFVNHAVLLVGYGSENGQDYWTIKNSWGSGWGEGGFIRMARNNRNQCFIADYASFPYM